MLNAHRGIYPLATAEEVSQMLAYQDGMKLPVDEDWLLNNVASATIMVNTWLLCLETFVPYSTHFLKEQLMMQGLVSVVTEFDQAVGNFLRGQLPTGLARSIFDELEASNLGPYLGNPEGLVGGSTEATWVFLMRFPKRFTIIKDDTLKKEAIDKFLSANKSCYYFSRLEIPRYIALEVRKEVESMLPWDKIAARFWGALNPVSCKAEIRKLAPTSGATADHAIGSAGKWANLIQDYRYPVVPTCFGRSWDKRGYRVNYWGKHKDHEVHMASVAAVPKSLTSYRIVAPEYSNFGALAKLLFSIVEDYEIPGVFLRDQTVNQGAAILSSLTGELATLDLSQASDLHSKALLYTVMPGCMIEILNLVLPSHVVVDGRRYLLHMAGTMGNANTFFLMSIVLRALLVTCVKTCQALLPDENIPSTVLAYGDDCVVPAKVAPTCIEWLKKCGFVVNEAKSWFTGDFRESCGADYYKGQCITPIYWPRHAFSLAYDKDTQEMRLKSRGVSTRGWDPKLQNSYLVDDLTSLISLQHRLYYISRAASNYLCDVVRELEPRMTFSYPGETCDDLWGYIQCEKRLAPMEHDFLHDGEKEYHWREVHLCSEVTPAILGREMRGGTKLDESEYDFLVYYRYLMEGPQYMSPLDKLLKVSTSRKNFEKETNDSTVTWTYKDC